MRDTRASFDYFQKAIEEKQWMVDFALNKLKESPSNSDTLEKSASVVITERVSMLIVKYSMGAELIEIKDYFQSICRTLVELKTGLIESYIECLQLLSLGICIESDSPEFLEVCKSISNSDLVDDKLISTLLNFIDSSIPVASSFLIKKPYKRLDSFFENPSEQELSNYLKKHWYKGHSDMAWYESHLNLETFNYEGYWSWETAALVKIFGINDSSLKDVEYYPFDILR